MCDPLAKGVDEPVFKGSLSLLKRDFPIRDVEQG